MLPMRAAPLVRGWGMVSQAALYRYTPHGGAPLKRAGPTFVRSLSTPSWSRTHLVADLAVKDVGTEVHLAGWVHPLREQSKHLGFVKLQDSTGQVQAIVRVPEEAGPAHDAALELYATLRDTPVQSAVVISGTLRLRPSRNVNAAMSTGGYELELSRVQVLNRAGDLPFAPHSPALANEALRAKYRYLDLRRPELASKIKLRSKVAHIVRNYLHDRGFDEVETPALLRSTPEGAAEFLVPFRQGRLKSDEPLFYALPQSPQQPKQLLIASGAVDKYFQFAKCFRDEDQRADRQPEFTQLDLEMGFVSPSSEISEAGDPEHDIWRIGGHEVRATVEGVMRSIWVQVKGEDPLHSGLYAREGATGLPVLTFTHAMRTYGSDKPDRRFGLKIHTLSDTLVSDPPEVELDMLVIPSVEGLGGKLEKGITSLKPNPSTQAVLNRIRRDPAVTLRSVECFKAKLAEPAANVAERILARSGLTTHLYGQSTNSSLEKATNLLASALSSAKQEAFRRSTDPESALIFLAPRLRAGTGGSSILGSARLFAASLIEATGRTVRSTQDDMFWVTEFPLFSRELTQDGTDVGWTSTHHPFTSPLTSQLSLLADPSNLSDESIAQLRGQHYDLVLNGMEIGGGSVRLHLAREQETVFRHILGLADDEIARFSHLLGALRSGAPPHGGLAIGTSTSGDALACSLTPCRV